MAIRNVHLGLPNWSSRAWSGLLYSSHARPHDYLAEYASVFNAVEGNTTFYRVPSSDVVERWREQTDPVFRFCFKFPRVISHERRLENVLSETEAFLDALRPLRSRLGPTWLQLPPSFGPESLETLRAFLHALPRDFDYAVEVRHRAFYRGQWAERLDDLLADRAIGRVVLDARGLSAADPLDPTVRAAQRQKPDVPYRASAVGACPMVRFLAHPEPLANRPLFVAWADTVTRWLEDGRRPHVFIHAPDDRFAPYLARALHEALSRRADVGVLPPWPGESEQPPPEQLSLFT